MYGLKQSLRAWFDRFMKAIQHHGFIQAQVDHTMSYKKQAMGITILIVYVDDFFFFFLMDKETCIDKKNSKAAQKYTGHIKTRLAEEFDMKDLGNLRYFLGMEITRNDYAISVSQRKYTLDLLKETDMMASKPTDTPMDSNVKLEKKMMKI